VLESRDFCYHQSRVPHASPPSGTFSFCLALLLTATPAIAADRDLIGYTALTARAGALQADGAGIPVSQVEAFAPGTADYAPDTALTAFAGKTFTLRSGASSISSHATQVAK
jgi:hypothetical protein